MDILKSFNHTHEFKHVFYPKRHLSAFFILASVLLGLLFMIYKGERGLEVIGGTIFIAALLFFLMYRINLLRTKGSVALCTNCLYLNVRTSIPWEIIASTEIKKYELALQSRKFYIFW